MIVKTRVFVLCFLVFGMCFSQVKKEIDELTISESPIFKEEATSDYVYSFSTLESGNSVVIRKGEGMLIIERFDKEMVKTYTEFVKLSEGEKCVGGFTYGEEVKFFTVQMSSREERIVFCHTFNLLLNTYHKNKKALFKSRVVKEGGLFYGRKRKETNFAVSPNGAYFVVAYNNSQRGKYSSAIHVYTLEDSKLVYAKSYQESKDVFYDHQNLKIDNNANVYSLGKKNLSENSGYELVLNKLNENQAEELVLSTQNDRIKSLVMSVVDSQMYLFGYYSQQEDELVTGGCSFKIDTDSFSVASKKMKPLPKEVFQHLTNKNIIRKENATDQTSEEFYIDYVLVDEENGSTYLLAEKFYITQVNVPNAEGVGYWIPETHYEDLLILKFDENADLDWGRSVYKKEHKQSYNAFVKNQKLHVLVNASRNLEKHETRITNGYKGVLAKMKTALYHVCYSASGGFIVDKIQDNSRKTKYYPNLGAYQNGAFKMMRLRKKKRRFMTLE